MFTRSPRPFWRFFPATLWMSRSENRRLADPHLRFTSLRTRFALGSPRWRPVLLWLIPAPAIVFTACLLTGGEVPGGVMIALATLLICAAIGLSHSAVRRSRCRLESKRVRLLNSALHTADPAQLARIGETVSRRRSVWTQRLKRGVPKKALIVVLVDGPSAIVGFIGFGAVLLLTLMYGINHPASSLVILSLHCGLIVPYIFYRRTRARAIRSLADSACPVCGYSLVGVPPALEPVLCAGVDVGPECCPECGFRWPLVPPE